MAKLSSMEKNKRRVKLSKQFLARRKALKATIMDKQTSFEDRFAAQVKLAELPRNSAKNRVRNRCELSGRPRGFYRKLRMSRIALRDLASRGELPGVIKASW
ncbi:30S ribosomal protein S14 [bacterium]|nr:30S ribosomal protein S14 [bacterium]